MSLPDPVARLVEELQRLPGIGPKSALRLAFHLLKSPREETDRLTQAVERAPRDERPGRAMPEPAEQHREHQVADRRRRSVP